MELDDVTHNTLQENNGCTSNNNREKNMKIFKLVYQYPDLRHATLKENKLAKFAYKMHIYIFLFGRPKSHATCSPRTVPIVIHRQMYQLS